jgi:hypothetical protein
LRRKPNVYHIANTTVYHAANVEDAAKVEEPHPSRRSPRPNAPQSPMTVATIATKCSAARRSIAPRTDAARSAAPCTKDFTTASADGFESGSEKMGDERIQMELNGVWAME